VVFTQTRKPGDAPGHEMAGPNPCSRNTLIRTRRSQVAPSMDATQSFHEWITTNQNIVAYGAIQAAPNYRNNFLEVVIHSLCSKYSQFVLLTGALRSGG